MKRVFTGLEHFLSDPPAIARGARIGLLTNPTGVDHALRSSIDLVAAHPDFRLTALFGPEHGVRGEVQAGGHIADDVDPRTGTTVHSLYGAVDAPTPAMFSAIDVMVIDLQDIGVRYYTYLATVARALDACAAHGLPAIVLDRPNPLGGDRVAGSRLDPAFASIVGIAPMPILHGLTIGEFARYWSRHRGLPAPLVAPLTGWRRSMWFDDTRLPWVQPSPNLPTLDSVIAYPGTCLLEGTNVSEGRGTTRPFEIVGAPWIEPGLLAAALADTGLPGVAFRPLSFTPTFSKHEGVRCGGVQVHVTDRHAFEAVALGAHLLRAVRALDPDAFTWLEPVSGEHFIDKLAGGRRLRETIEGGGDVAALLREWDAEAVTFRKEWSDILLYRDDESNPAPASWSAT